MIFKIIFGLFQEPLCNISLLKVTSISPVIHFQEVSGSAEFQMIELPAVCRAQPNTIGQHLFNNPCPIATTVTWQTTTTTQRTKGFKEFDLKNNDFTLFFDLYQDF